MAAEFAREQGKFQPFHESLFSAYFSQGLDIGNTDILAQLALGAGLDPDEMQSALRSGRYILKLEEARQEAGLLGISGVPTFLVDNKRTIVGAQPLDVFRKVLSAVR